MPRVVVSLPLLLALVSCGSPPKPPTVDESRKRPVNTAMAVELQGCKSDLQNARLLASESLQVARSTYATATRTAQRESGPMSGISQRNAIYTLRFGFGSTRVNLSEAERANLVTEARDAPLIVLRGRTDGTADSASEARIARERAAAVQVLLVQGGIEPARIRATWQPAGDHAADNATAEGRELNRRVEIEIYRALPQSVALGASSPL